MAVVVRHSMPHVWRIASAVREYVRQNPPLRLTVSEANANWCEAVAVAGSDGVIGFFTRAEEHQLRSLGLPKVNVATQLPGVCPRVIPDHAAIGALAADHLLEAGWKRFRFVSFQSDGFARFRWEGFRDRLAARGHASDWVVWDSRVTRRIDELLDCANQPVAVCTADDGCGLQLAQELTAQSIPIPHRVAIVSVNNEEKLCVLSPTPLSSIDMDSERIGWEAAAMLHAMLRGETVQDKAIPPRGVVQRDSSEPTAADDPPVDFALRYIRQHACEGMTVNDLMEHLSISRRTLEKRFFARLGRTLLDETRRVRLLHAQQLLTETDLLVIDVAMHCGYSKHSSFTEQFTEQVGMSPTAFRRRRTLARSPQPIRGLR